MSRRLAIAAVVGNWIGGAVVSWVLGRLIESTSAPSPLRDTIVLLMWPIVVIGSTAIIIVWIVRTTARDPKEPISDQPTSETTLSADERFELNELRANHAVQVRVRKYGQLEQLQKRATELIETYDTAQAPSDPTEGVRDLERFDAQVKSVIGDVPEDVDEYEAPINLVWSGLTWIEHIVAELKIRLERLTAIRARYV